MRPDERLAVFWRRLDFPRPGEWRGIGANSAAFSHANRAQNHAAFNFLQYFIGSARDASMAAFGAFYPMLIACCATYVPTPADARRDYPLAKTLSIVGLVQRDSSDAVIRKILGENVLRVARANFNSA